MRVGFLVILFCCLYVHAAEFLYPVGYHPERNAFYVMYQKGATHLELWEWDAQTQYAQQLLLSRYTPAGFTFLPDYSGFSFIDNGMLKVKQPLKRSPRTIEYNAPLYNVEQVNWIDSRTCYASGKYQDYFGIFQIDWEGDVSPLILKEECDYLYPQKIDSTLFFIERSQKGMCRIACTDYQAPDQQDDFNSSMMVYLENQPKIHGVIPFETPLAFLHMVSDTEGFVVSYPENLLQKNPAVPFEYYRIMRSKEGWEKSHLFTFTIPTSLLAGKDRLYESILPLLPRICQSGIYYVDSSQTSFLGLYYYDMEAQEKRTLIENKGQHLLGIMNHNSGIAYGGQLGGEVEMVEGVQMHLGHHFG